MPDTDLARVREVLMRELETINHYEALARAAEAAELRAFFLHLAEEEKEHVAEATFWIRKLDPGQQAQFAKDFAQAHFDGQAPLATPPGKPASPLADVRLPSDPREVLHAIPAFPTAAAGALTVGPLKRRG